MSTYPTKVSTIQINGDVQGSPLSRKQKKLKDELSKIN